MFPLALPPETIWKENNYLDNLLAISKSLFKASRLRKVSVGAKNLKKLLTREGHETALLTWHLPDIDLALTWQ